MKPTESDLEGMLRNAPQPRPAADLKPKLIEDIPTPAPSPSPRSQTIVYRRPWWSRWWPSFATGGLAVCCLVVWGVQQSEIRELKQTIAEHQPLSVEANAGGYLAANTKTAAAAPIPNARAEIEELRRIVQQLTEEVRALEALQAENQQIRSQSTQPATFTQEEMQVLQQAKTRADSIRCVNNLKQLGLAVRVYATDHGDTFPPNVLALQNETGGATAMLICPDDTTRQPAANWQSLNAGNISYEYLAANGLENEPSRIMFRCPIHGNVTLCDGSVQQGIGKNHPDWLVQRDGKLYLEGPNQSGAKASPSGTVRQGMSPEMMRRYGLTPQQVNPAPTNTTP